MAHTDIAKPCGASINDFNDVPECDPDLCVLCRTTWCLSGEGVVADLDRFYRRHTALSACRNSASDISFCAARGQSSLHGSSVRAGLGAAAGASSVVSVHPCALLTLRQAMRGALVCHECFDLYPILKSYKVAVHTSSAVGNLCQKCEAQVHPRGVHVCKYGVKSCVSIEACARSVVEDPPFFDRMRACVSIKKVDRELMLNPDDADYTLGPATLQWANMAKNALRISTTWPCALQFVWQESENLPRNIRPGQKPNSSLPKRTSAILISGTKRVVLPCGASAREITVALVPIGVKPALRWRAQRALVPESPRGYSFFMADNRRRCKGSRGIAPARVSTAQEPLAETGLVQNTVHTLPLLSTWVPPGECRLVGPFRADARVLLESQRLVPGDKPWTSVQTASFDEIHAYYKSALPNVIVHRGTIMSTLAPESTHVFVVYSDENRSLFFQSNCPGRASCTVNVFKTTVGPGSKIHSKWQQRHLQVVSDFVPSRVYSASASEFPSFIGACHARRVLKELCASAFERSEHSAFDVLTPPGSPVRLGVPVRSRADAQNGQMLSSADGILANGSHDNQNGHPLGPSAHDAATGMTSAPKSTGAKIIRKRRAEPAQRHYEFSRIPNFKAPPCIPLQLRHTDMHHVDECYINERKVHAVRMCADGEVDVIPITFNRNRVPFFGCVACGHTYSSIVGLYACLGPIDPEKWYILQPPDGGRLASRDVFTPTLTPGAPTRSGVAAANGGQPASTASPDAALGSSRTLEFMRRATAAATECRLSLYQYLTRRTIDYSDVNIPGFVCNPKNFMATSLTISCDPDNARLPPRAHGRHVALKSLSTRLLRAGLRVMCIYIQDLRETSFRMLKETCYEWTVGVIVRIDDASAGFLMKSATETARDAHLDGIRCEQFCAIDDFTAGTVYRMLHRIRGMDFYCPGGFHDGYERHRDASCRHGPSHYSNAAYPLMRVR